MATCPRSPALTLAPDYMDELLLRSLYPEPITISTDEAWLTVCLPLLGEEVSEDKQESFESGGCEFTLSDLYQCEELLRDADTVPMGVVCVKKNEDGEPSLPDLITKLIALHNKHGGEPKLVAVEVPPLGPRGECSIYCQVACGWSNEAEAGPGCPRYKEEE